MAGYVKGSVAHIEFLVKEIKKCVDDDDIVTALEFLNYLDEENPRIADAVRVELAICELGSNK